MRVLEEAKQIMISHRFQFFEEKKRARKKYVIDSYLLLK
jgi:hypothetical protein